ncbi:MAG: glycosyltransferase family 4 protein [Candidatus Hydrogenedentes bacterium]|nr:glycosyltransferase family 4 protein [Candidatus Hydrogenedentota bacterium]
MHTNSAPSIMQRMDRPIRILHLAESPYVGGINAHIVSVVRAFAGDPSVRVSVAALSGRREDRWLIDALGEKNVDVIPTVAGFDVGARDRVRGYVADGGFDLVHTHNYRATVVAAYAGLPVPVVNTSHGMIVGPGLKLRAYQWLERRAMRRLAQTAAVSDFVRGWLIKKGVSAGQVRIIHNGYAPPPNSAQLDRAALGIARDAVVFLFAGRLVHGKGVREFIDALRGIDGAHAVIVGDGPLRADSEAVAHAARVPTHFAGAQRDVAPYYRLADVVVLPSRMEALPMTLIEAAAHGKPTVASNVGGIPEVVVHDETGLLVKARDRALLHDALRRCMDADLRARLGRAARERWRHRFTLEKMAAALRTLYTDALAR